MKLSENLCPKCGKISPRGQFNFGNAPVKCVFCGHEYYLDLTEVVLKGAEKAPKKINYKLLPIKDDEIKMELQRRNREKYDGTSEMSLTVKEILSKTTFEGITTEELEEELLRRKKI